ncbi:hypothetical protein INH39_03155 [Massilia violaceinigra]|uniref:DUF3108 domain-containing protein n=1 Tax=Massilia violaceinigra TaxID=2045208 RepID=A0ABY4A7J0_9BURK|nr:hypothetical protein [Massilia violaceinigra]UOD30754.1 hypothetical protein INH39_03155 [Massilia violaceinigra]
MRTPRRALPALIMAATLAPCSYAAVTSVDVGPALPRAALVKEGVHHYLRYLHNGDARIPLDIITREIRFSTEDGQQRMRITQRYDTAAAAPSLKTVTSWFDAGSFRPRTHERIAEKDGKRVVEGFVFAPDKITGMKDLADSVNKDLVVASPEPTFNFETDIETLQALPLADGFEARINFYHPGSQQGPARYLFKVTGSASLPGPGGMIDCWVVTTDYNRPGTVSTFWFAKGSQLMMRQDSPVGEGKVAVKILID